MKYRELNIKEKIKDMSEDEIYELLASDGMLIKRPLFISDTLILKGFKEKEWEQIKGENNVYKNNVKLCFRLFEIISRRILHRKIY